MKKKTQTSLKFSELGLERWLVKICKKRNLIFPTIIQQVCIPPALSKKDLLVFSSPGSGKTLAFLLPVLHLTNKMECNLFSTILIPTKEIGFSIYTLFNDLGKVKKINCRLLEKNFFCEENVKIGVNCLIVTPNLLFFLTKLKKIYSNFKKTLFVFSEIDIVIRNFFFPQTFFLFKLLYPKQLLIFGVNLTKELNFLTRNRFEKNFFFFHEKRNYFSFFFSLKQEYVFCPIKSKIKFLMAILKTRGKHLNENQKNKNTFIIFFSYKRDYIRASIELHKMGFFVVNFKENPRKDCIVFSSPHQKKITVILTNKFVPKSHPNFELGLIINFDFPEKIKKYIHRVRETCRSFRPDSCLSLVSQGEIKHLADFENQTGVCLKKSQILKEKHILSFFLTKREFL